MYSLNNLLHSVLDSVKHVDLKLISVSLVLVLALPLCWIYLINSVLVNVRMANLCKKTLLFSKECCLLIPVKSVVQHARLVSVGNPTSVNYVLPT